MILIFLIHPKQISSRVQSSVCSIAGGLITPLELEYKIVVLELLESTEPGPETPSVLDFRLMLFNREAAGAVLVAVDDQLFWLALFERREGFLDIVLMLEVLSGCERLERREGKDTE